MNSLSLKSILALVQNAGPYVLVELLLPGGTLIALTMWFVRQRRAERTVIEAEAISG